MATQLSRQCLYVIYLYVHNFTQEYSYDLDRSGGRKSEIVKCLCPEREMYPS